MEYFRKDFVVPASVAKDFCWDSMRINGTFNSRKFGRNRRGMVAIDGVEGRERSDGLWDLSVRFVKGKSSRMRVVDIATGQGSRFQVYPYVDFRKILRPLAKHNVAP